MASTSLGRVLQIYLMASYLYYHLSKSVMEDEQYDKLARILKNHWTEFEHQHKHLVTLSDLEAGTLYGLKASDYPGMVVGGALLMLDEYERGLL